MPPEALATAVPSHAPLHVGDIALAVIEIPVGSVSVTLSTIEQPLPSVKVTK